MRHAEGFLASAHYFQGTDPHAAAELIAQAVTQLVKAHNQLDASAADIRTLDDDTPPQSNTQQLPAQRRRAEPFENVFAARTVRARCQRGGFTSRGGPARG